MAACAALVKRLESIGSRVLKARQEEDFLAYMAEALRTQVDCDAVIIRLFERYIQTRAVATTSGVEVLSPMELVAPFTEEDERLCLSAGDGVFAPMCARRRTSSPSFAAMSLNWGWRQDLWRPSCGGRSCAGKWCSPGVPRRSWTSRLGTICAALRITRV